MKWKTSCTGLNPPKCTEVCSECGYPKPKEGAAGKGSLSRGSPMTDTYKTYKGQ